LYGKGKMADKPISTQPLNDNEKLLRQKFYENIAAQSDLMDKLGERLLTLELAIPGAYATALKLLYGDKVTITPGTIGTLAFIFWEDAQKYFESVSKMAVDSKAPPEYRELGKVLQQYMSGNKQPDLSGLPQELAGWHIGQWGRGEVKG